MRSFLKSLLLAAAFLMINPVFSQTFTRKDSLQGGMRFERACYDVQRYDINIRINPSEKFLSGYNEITLKTVETTSKIQLDLFDNMKIDSIIWNAKRLTYKREFNAVFVEFPEAILKDSTQRIQFYYSGKPVIAPHAPWSGGFIFSKDSVGNHWIGLAVQGTGASLWYPCKDSQTDEPDLGATIKVAVPNGLMDVSNGKLIGSEDLKDGYTRWDWEVKNPINNYDLTINIGDYVHFGENYKGLDLNYYVLRENEEKARKQFEVVKPMMDCFQSKFGPYPFPEDGYKLVDTPYLGMEHQSAVAYGNKYKMGYLGRDLSGTGVGMNFDYIIIHESGHEWFGNSITSTDVADMWIHEGFTMYTEVVFAECIYGYDKAMQYLNGIRQSIGNTDPVVGQFGVNHEGSNDMYPKGAWLVHTIRSIVNDDAKWWPMLLEYTNTFRHKIITTEDVEQFFSKKTGYNLRPVFDQYLRYTNYPTLELRKYKKKVQYRWKTDVDDFEMPFDLKIVANQKTMRLNATNNWQSFKFEVKTTRNVEIQVQNFLFRVERLN
ncbi:MAG: peptidase M1 [Flavobacterium sp. BFFFF1]|uniref:M1 family metallopeptidase n=1 Tax=Flavobacterium sp. BFFFF1 TaxID=2015557 RepID=UPI000BC453D5|nr:M1 family metallopeptidase [Flavobacterium sp. BFFFF1]OYU81290.1 MAG: peptidase M1 [Flavobacterium sp. BFFFF1]